MEPIQNLPKIKVFFSILSLFFPLFVWSQKPTWCNREVQEKDYPNALYYKGNAQGKRSKGETPEQATKRIADIARAELSGMIRIAIQSTSESERSERLQTSQNTSSFESTDLFQSHTTTSTNLLLYDVNVETWTNPRNKRIYAFAYINKERLSQQLENDILLRISNIETSLLQIDSLMAVGHKIQARHLAEEIPPRLDDLAQQQMLLASVTKTKDTRSVHLIQTQTLQQRTQHYLSILQNGINLYIECSAELFGESFSAFCNTIEGKLSALGCTFVPSADNADYAININAISRQYNAPLVGNSHTYFSYVDATIRIQNGVTGQTIYTNERQEKGGHTLDYTQAARQAYQSLAPKIASDIIEQLK